jgi:hypothetical protein
MSIRQRRRKPKKKEAGEEGQSGQSPSVTEETGAMDDSPVQREGSMSTEKTSGGDGLSQPQALIDRMNIGQWKFVVYFIYF